MQIREITNLIEEKYPLQIQEKWDNGGYQIDFSGKILKNILITLEITQESIDFAIKNDCNLIISHHPLIFMPTSKIINSDFKGNKIIKLIQNEISLYATHTAVDQNGFNEFVFKNLGFESEGFVIETSENHGYGSIANVDISLDEISNKIKKYFDIKDLVFWGNKNHFTKIALVTGDGMSFYKEALEKDVDLFITGDVKHHDAMDAMESGLNIIDITHEASERKFNDFIFEYLQNLDIPNDIKIYKYENENKYLRKII